MAKILDNEKFYYTICHTIFRHIGLQRIESINSLAKQALPLEQGVLVLVGDKSLVLGQLKDLQLPAPVELNAEGDKISSK